jgi:inosine/xanthosine triphosphatase
MPIVKILVASKNPVKIKAATDAFTKFFDSVEIVSKEIIIADKNAHQPIGWEQTQYFSKQRVLLAEEKFKGFDYYIGIESGVMKLNSTAAYIIVYSSVGHNSKIHTTKGCEIPLPMGWYESLSNSKDGELGDIAERESGVRDIKKKQGIVGFFSQNHVTRYDISLQSIIMSLVPFLNDSLF